MQKRQDIRSSDVRHESIEQAHTPAEQDSEPGVSASAVENNGKRRRSAGVHDPAEVRRRAYEFTPLSPYKLTDRLLIRAADLFFYFLIRFICKTVTWEVRGLEHLDELRRGGHQAIFTFWHSCIFSATWFWRRRGIVVMSSMSKDGEYISRFIKRLGYGAAKGSASRGAGRALLEMTECLSSGLDTAFTIDGPRGPAFVAKAGAVTLARHSGQAILPFHIGLRRYKALPSWDRLQIPFPFTKAVVLIGPPILVRRDSNADQIDDRQVELQAVLDRLRRECEIAFGRPAP